MSTPETGDVSSGDVPFIMNRVQDWTVVEFRTASLMDPLVLERTGQALYHLIDAEDRRMIILDFSQVQYISSQAIGIVLTMNKKLSGLKRSKFVLCGVGEKLMQLIKITRLDRLLTIKPTQEEAVKVQNIL
ncbi:MAG: STAS domain-containing protein [Burkholderiales bacterium]|nr:STAS domain-containing protein [Phycisphaerae bacterium]